ncbi:MAG: sterol desaturase family protein [Rhodospirillales bacterium]|nr:sterol desaturase family protein [Rhodospirillales bacterium]MBO6786849.1 sterol desaturase family protein [Rhodospirillales bacterium]
MSALQIAMTGFAEHVQLRKRGLLNFIGVLAASLIVGTALPWLMFFGGPYVDTLAPVYEFLGIKTPGMHVLLFPTAMVGVAVICLVVEAIGLGYRDSTLFLVIEGDNRSVRSDLFYLFLRVSGVATLVTFVMTLGTALHVDAMTALGLDFSLIHGTHPVVQFFVLVLAITFCNYWTHRLLHSRWFFELHKVHHSAEHLGVLLPFRAHPLDHYLARVYTTASLSLFGIEPSVLIAWMGINAFYQSMVHSKIDWPKWTEYIVVTPALHRIHHSTEPRHFNKNMSILTIWDKLFGTYHPPEDVPGYGLDGVDRDNFNTDHYLSEVFLCFARWIGLKRNT